MIYIRKSSERGNTKIGWLNSLHTFSFGEYHDLKFMGFSDLRVINQDIVQPGYGFGKHPHNDMEIISYVIDGSLEHKDSLGTGSIIKPGEIQRMSAGTGILHSEFNHSETDLLHFLQIWIIPEKKGLQPSYEQNQIPRFENKLILVGSRDGGDNVITIHQDVELYVAYLNKNHSLKHAFKNRRKGWLQLIKGNILLNGEQLSAGDGAAITDEKEIHVESISSAELLLFDLS